MSYYAVIAPHKYTALQNDGFSASLFRESWSRELYASRILSSTLCLLKYFSLALSATSPDSWLSLLNLNCIVSSLYCFAPFSPQWITLPLGVMLWYFFFFRDDGVIVSYPFSNVQSYNRLLLSLVSSVVLLSWVWLVIIECFSIGALWWKKKINPLLCTKTYAPKAHAPCFPFLNRSPECTPTSAFNHTTTFS